MRQVLIRTGLKGVTALISILVISTVLTASCQPTLQPLPKLESSERLISRIDPSWEMRQRVLNGVRSYYIDQFSPDGKRVAYRASNGEGKFFVVLDDIKGKPYDWTVAYTFSPDSRRFVYIAQAGDEYFVVVDGIEGKHYGGIPPDQIGLVMPDSCSISQPVFSPDNQRLGYVVEMNGKYRLVIDGIEGALYDWIYFDNRGAIPGIVFSPDSTRLAYIAGTAYTQGSIEQEFTVIDGIEGKRYDHVSKFAFSPDSKRTAYVATVDQKRFAVIDGIEQPQDGVNSIVFSQNSERVSYAAGSPGSRYVVVDGIEGKKYDHVSAPLFSPDSKDLAYLAQLNEKWMVIVNGKEGKPYAHIQNPVIFSSDSSHIAYSVKDNDRWFVVVDGKENTLYDQVSAPVFSPDGKRVAYVSRSRSTFGSFVVVDGVEGKHYAYIYQQPVFSPDSKRIAYAVQNGGGEMVVVDGVEGKRYDDILGGIQSSSLVFDSPVRLRYLAESGYEVYLVEQTIR